MKIRYITPHSGEWPRPLRELHPSVSPEGLFAVGRELAVDDKTVAIVGTRRPTVAGLETAARLARGLAEAGCAVVSGMAMGIDAIAHRAALDAGGYTIAVLGAGLDVDYPQRNRRLRRDIEDWGTLVSELPLGSQPMKANFPKRNRIIAGLSKGVIVVEGGLRSGALITARLALDLNREVWAVPGSVRNPMATGPNELIRNHEANLVTEVKHVLDHIAPGLVWKDAYQSGLHPVLELDEEEMGVLRLMDDVPLAPDRVCSELGLPPGRAALTLSRLEVRGLISKRRAGYELSAAGGRARAALG
ncbi:MAG: DNA-processing protein DprA [Actinomycetota bacterium]